MEPGTSSPSGSAKTPPARREIRELFWSQGTISATVTAGTVTAGKDAAAAKYRDYFDWREPIASTPSHRILAMLRGEKESLLSVHIAPPVSSATAILERIFVRAETEAAQQIGLAIRDRYKPLLESALETEVRKAARVRAEDTAIGVFADNLRQLLLAPALGPAAHPGPGSRISLRLQIGVSGPAGPSAAPRYRLSAARGTG